MRNKIIIMKLISTTDYLLLIDEKAEIKEGVYYFSNQAPRFCVRIEKKDSIYPYVYLNKKDEEIRDFHTWRGTISAYYPLTKEAKDLDLPLLPPFEDVVDTNIQTRNFNKQVKNPYLTEEKGYQVWERAYIEGFDDGLAQSNKQFSLEDIKNLFKNYFDWCLKGNATLIDTAAMDENINKFFNLSQSLSTQQLPKEFIPEYEFDCCNRYQNCKGCDATSEMVNKRLKTTINSKGQIELVGTYKY